MRRPSGSRARRDDARRLVDEPVGLRFEAERPPVDRDRVAGGVGGVAERRRAPVHAHAPRAEQRLGAAARGDARPRRGASGAGPARRCRARGAAQWRSQGRARVVVLAGVVVRVRLAVDRRAGVGAPRAPPRPRARTDPHRSARPRPPPRPPRRASSSTSRSVGRSSRRARPNTSRKRRRRARRASAAPAPRGARRCARRWRSSRLRSTAPASTPRTCSISARVTGWR